MYIDPSSGHISLNFLNMPFKLILRRFEVVFWCLEWECCTFLKDWWKFIQIHQYYTMALISSYFSLHLLLPPSFFLLSTSPPAILSSTSFWIYDLPLFPSCPLLFVCFPFALFLPLLRCYKKPYRKASSRGAYGHDPFWSVFEEYPLESTRSDSTMTLSII